MKNIVPFGTAVPCDCCQGEGSLWNEGEPTRVVCPQCFGIGEIRVSPKAVEGPKDHPLNYERPKFDWGRFMGQMDIFAENLRETESLGYAITQDLKDNDMNETVNEMLVALNQAGEKARQLLRRAASLRGGR